MSENNYENLSTKELIDLLSEVTALTSPDNYDDDKIIRACCKRLESFDSQIIEMGLCETEQVILKPDQLYKFVEMPNCKRCAELAKFNKNQS